jgi:parallel beta-helix repeat protein
VNSGAKFTVFGATKSPYGLSLTNLAGAIFSFDIANSSAVNWAAGDIIAFGPTSGNGTATTEVRNITSVVPNIFPGVTRVNFDNSVPTGHTITDDTPFPVVNLTRNVVIRSSGTDTTKNTAYVRNLVTNTADFSINYGEFFGLGTNASGKYGITFDGGSVRGEISSSSVRSNYNSLRVNAADDVTFKNNVFFGSVSDNVYIGAVADRVTLENNHIAGGSAVGVHLNNGSEQTYTDNWIYSNSSRGIQSLPSGALGNIFDGNRLFSNSSDGLYLQNSSQNDIVGNYSYNNAGASFFNSGTASSTFRNNQSYETKPFY